MPLKGENLGQCNFNLKCESVLEVYQHHVAEDNFSLLVNSYFFQFRLIVTIQEQDNFIDRQLIINQ